MSNSEIIQPETEITTNISNTESYTHNYVLGDIVWAKVKGWPHWPATIVDPATIPDYVHLAKPKATDETIVVKFFSSRDYSWLSPLNLKHFTENYDSCFSKGTKRKQYIEAVKLASDPEARALEEQEYTNSLLQSKKRSRKSDVPESISLNDKIQDSPIEKPAKTPGRKPKKPKPEISEIPKSVSDYEIILRLRIKLQKFLQQTTPHEDDDFQKTDIILKETENLAVDYELFKQTKIGKVVKMISKMKLLKDDYNILSRTQSLLTRWRTELENTQALTNEKCENVEMKSNDAQNNNEENELLTEKETNLTQENSVKVLMMTSDEPNIDVLLDLNEKSNLNDKSSIMKDIVNEDLEISATTLIELQDNEGKQEIQNNEDIKLQSIEEPLSMFVEGILFECGVSGLKSTSGSLSGVDDARMDIEEIPDEMLDALMDGRTI